MTTFRDKLRHAFAVEPPGEAEPTEEQQVPVDWLCRFVADRHLTTPGVIALEMARPLNYFGAMSMRMIEPAVCPILPRTLFGHYQEFAGFLERRGSIDFMIRRLEELNESLRDSDDRAPQEKCDEAS